METHSHCHNTAPIYDTEKLADVQNTSDNAYNVFAHERTHPESPKSINDTYVTEQGGSNITYDTLDMDHNGDKLPQDVSDHEQVCALILSLVDTLNVKIKNCTTVIQNHKKENEVVN